MERRGYPGRRPLVRRRDTLPYQRTYLGEHSGTVFLLVLALVALAAVSVFFMR